MIGNPIIRREVLSSLRSRKAIAMQAMFLLVTAGLMYLYWPADGMQDLNNEDAKRIFSILAIGELLMVALFAPAFTAASLTVEKEHGTFESVFSTALSPWQIATGKMVGSLAFLVLMVLSGLPALAAPLMLGGIEPGQVLACLGVLLLTAVYLGMIGLLISSMMHRSYRAVIVTYAMLGVILVFLAAPMWPMSRHLVSGGVQQVLYVPAALSPLQAMMSVVWESGQSGYVPELAGMRPFWELFVPLSLAMIAVTATVCVIKLHRPIAPPRPREKLKIVERGHITARTFMFLLDPRKRKRMIRWWQNPVLIKEFRTRPMMQPQWLARALSVCLILSVVLAIAVVLAFQTLTQEVTNPAAVGAQAVGALMAAVVILVGPAMAGGTICGDIETGVWDLMRSTPLPSWRIVSGKFQAAILPMLLLVLGMLPAMGILLYFDSTLLVGMIRTTEVVLMTVLLVATAGMFFSGLLLRTAAATAWTYALVVTGCLATLLVMLGQDRFSPGLRDAMLQLNPVAVVLNPAMAPQFLKLSALAAVAMVAATVLRIFQLRRAT